MLPLAKGKGLGVPARTPPWWWPRDAGVELKAPALTANRLGLSRLCAHRQSLAVAPEPKKRPHSATVQAKGCNNLQGVTVTSVEGHLQLSGPPDKVALVDPIAKQLLFLGDRRGAQDHLRNNRRAIRNRFEEYFQPGETETPEQLLRFADAKARRLPWEADSTT
eukprot:1542697-Amphidinium_carterae.1